MSFLGEGGRKRVYLAHDTVHIPLQAKKELIERYTDAFQIGTSGVEYGTTRPVTSAMNHVPADTRPTR